MPSPQGVSGRSTEVTCRPARSERAQDSTVHDSLTLFRGADHEEPGLLEVQAEGFLADDVLARGGRIQRGLAVEIVGQAQHDHLDLVQL